MIAKGSSVVAAKARRRKSSRDTPVISAAIARAQTGDIGALQFLYARYADDVLRCVRSVVEDVHEAEDITHDIFLKLMAIIASYEPREVPFAAWIMRVARNCAFDYHRGRRPMPFEEVRVSVDDSGPLRAERRRDFYQALLGLPTEQRDVLILRHIKGFSPPEIANMLGKTESAIHGLHHRGRTNLRNALEELGTTPVVIPLRQAQAA